MTRKREDVLDMLRDAVNRNLAYGPLAAVELVTNDHGDCPVVVALDDESLAIVLGRVRAVGGYGTVVSRGAERDRIVSLIQAEGSLAPSPDVLTPGATASFGMFLDHVELHPEGVSIPAAFDAPAKARDAHEVELAET